MLKTIECDKCGTNDAISYKTVDSKNRRILRARCKNCGEKVSRMPVIVDAKGKMIPKF